MSDFPDDWFRPAGGPAGEEPPPTTSQPSSLPAADEERFTDQFKPGYVPHRDHHPHPPAPVQPATATAGGTSATTGTTGNATRTSHQVGVVASEPDVLDEPRRGLPGWVALGIGALAFLGVGILVGDLLHQGSSDSSSLTDPQASSAPLASGMAVSGGASSSPAIDAPWSGPVRTVRADSVTASCTAPDQPGYDGATVSSRAGRMLDDDLTTGWRCDGDAVGQTLTFTFPKGTRLVGVQLTNGYTKTVTGGSLYPQYRRATQVSWSFPAAGDAWFQQDLKDGVRTPQEIRIPPTDADDGLRMTVERTTEPGRSDTSRNALVLTQVQFLVANG